MPPRSPTISVLDDVGDHDAEPGSAAWAKWFVWQTKKTREELESEASSLCRLLDKLEKHEAWKPLNLASFSMLCSKELGLSSENVDAIRKAKPGEKVQVVLGKHGGDRKSRNDQVNNVNLIGGNDPSYLTARIRRDNPELAEKLEAGEFKSVRAAALAAGIVQPSFQCPADPIKASRRILRHFRDDRLTALLSELANHAGYDLTPRG